MPQKQKASIMDADGMRRAIHRISYEILEKNRGARDIVLVGIVRRGAVVAERIADKIFDVEGIRPPVVRLDITPWRDDRKSTQACAGDGFEGAVEVEGATVILVDDVLYTGRTVRAAIEAVFSRGRARAIRLAVLIDRGHRELPIRPDYVGKNLPTSASERVRVLVNEYDGAEGVAILEREADA